MSDHNDGIPLLLSKVEELAASLPEDYCFLEIGTNSGETSRDIIQRLAGSKRWLFSVDPYGSKPYLLDGGYLPGDQTLYNEDTYKTAMKMMADDAVEYNVNWAFYRMLSLDFFKLLPKIEFWSEGKIMKPKFGFVFLDGAHEMDTVRKEVEWCKKNMDRGLIVVDDWHYVQDLPYTGQVAHDRLYIEL